MAVFIFCTLVTLFVNFLFLGIGKCVVERKKIKVKNYTKDELPFKIMTDGSVCADCIARISTEIEVGQRVTIPLGFALELPDLMEAVIRPRSGLSKRGIDVQIGTIDTDYRGEVSCTIANNSDKTFYVADGDRICQIAFRYVPPVSFKMVNHLSQTKRGSDGFGSTGVK